MAACRSLQHIFESPLPENPTLIESLSRSQIKPIEQSSFTEIFGELHFKESPEILSPPSSSSSQISTSSSIDFIPQKDASESSDLHQIPSSVSILSTPETNRTHSHRSSESFSSLNLESLQLCTEGLGFESSDDVEELKTGIMNEHSWETEREKVAVKKHIASENSYGECRRSRVSWGEYKYPPPISSIGRNGKPWVCFRSYRSNGRFVLKEIRIPTQEVLHACREDGRLKLNFVQPDHDEFIEEEDEEEDDEEEENTEKENDACVTDQVNEEKEIDV